MMTAWILLALGAPVAAGSQEIAPAPIIDGLQEQVRVLEEQDGPNSPDLIQPLAALGLAYREHGEPALATAALESAVHLVRFNFGPHSLEQAPLIRQLIANADSLGDHWSAWQLERDLMSLARRHPHELGSVQILSDTADRRMDMLAKYDAGQFPPEVIYGCYYSGPHVQRDLDPVPDGHCTSGSVGAAREGLAIEAQAYYMHAVDIILRNGDYSSDDLPRLLNEIIKISYEHGDPSIGKKSLNYLLAYETSNSAPLLDRVDTLLQIADWDLLHANGLNELDAALAEYAQAYYQLQGHGADEESIRRMFAPDTPVALPVFIPSPVVAEGGDDTPGHVDAAVELDKYGRCRHVRVIDPGNEATRAVERHVKHVILQRRFRPRLVGGRVADRDRVVIRYPLND
jgi:hypothetical protein